MSSGAPGSVRGALSQRGFAAYMAGNTLSSCGTWFQNIAQTLLVYRLTNSVFLVGVVNLAQFASVLFLGPSAGVAADRYDRRRLLLVTQLLSATVTGTLALLASTGHAGVVVVIGAALVLGLAQTFSVPAMLALVPQLVPAEHLNAAVALNIVTFNVARAVGPVLGAVVVSVFGISAAFAVNSLSFVVWAGVLSLIHTARPVRASTEVARPRLRDTARSLRARPEMARLFIAGTCASVTIDPVTTLSPAFATDIFGRPDTLVGWMVGAFGLGAVFAGLWVSGRGWATDSALGARMAVLVVAMLVFALVPSLTVALLALVLAGFGFIAVSAAALARVQGGSDDGELGRLMALWAMAFMGARPVASVFDGALATATDVRFATIVVTLPALGAVVMLRRAGSADAVEAI
jgi:MFS family permease